MNHLVKVAHGIDTAPLLLEIARQPKLWNRHNYRRDGYENSPHVQADDIWLRYNDEKPFRESGNWEGFHEPHDPVFYPEWYALPHVRPIVFGMMARVEGTRLGGILITRVPPGGRILPHVDKGWHVSHYNTKLYVVLQSNPQCVVRVEDEKVAMAPGEAWYFDNTREHELVNDGPDDRISLIVSIRCEK